MLVHTKIDFTKKILDWDGFGFNYVETAQTPNYQYDPQDYGGFDILSEQSKQEIIQLIFGEDGLRPNLIKMFLDPFHQKESQLNPTGYNKILDENYDHETTTKQMLYFVKEGYRLSKAAERPYEVITALYGPPSFMTKQRLMRGRDLDPAYTEELAKYMVAWVKFLRNKEGLPVRYMSIHNEGEDYSRWPEDGNDGNIGSGHDYNLYWTPEQVSEFIPFLSEVLEINNLGCVGVTPGETSNWTRFYNWGYANEISDNPRAIDSLGLITSHGFSGGLTGQTWHGDHRSAGVDLLRDKKPCLHSWVTSTSWSKMDAEFIYQMHGNIYSAKSNGIIPWAGIQRPSKWVGGDPNPGNAIQINEDGSYQVRAGYYYYKQICPVGQAGMYVAQTYSTNTCTCAIAFASNNTKNPDSFILVNTSDQNVRFDLTVVGETSHYHIYRTSNNESCTVLNDITLKDGKQSYQAPANSVTTFVAKLV